MVSQKGEPGIDNGWMFPIQQIDWDSRVSQHIESVDNASGLLDDQNIFLSLPIFLWLFSINNCIVKFECCSVYAFCIYQADNAIIRIILFL